MVKSVEIICFRIKRIVETENSDTRFGRSDSDETAYVFGRNYQTEKLFPKLTVSQ